MCGKIKKIIVVINKISKKHKSLTLVEEGADFMCSRKKSAIGIVTISSDNYGNRLQNYAVQEVLENFGFGVVTFKNGYSYLPLAKMLKLKVIETIKIILKLGNYLKTFRKKSFKKFNKKYINFSQDIPGITNIDPDKYDYIVCGSDQIWNLTYSEISDYMNPFFAGFVPQNRRIAYSASIGIDYIPERFKDEFVKYITEMKSISVREENAQKIIKSMTGREVPVTLDPTLMLSKSDWLKISEKPKWIKSDKFILTYFLGDLTEDRRNYINKIAEIGNIDVIDLYDIFTDANRIVNKSAFSSNPSEFIWLISNCELMMTDSFHGCIFSMIMDKPFRCFKRQDSAEDMSSRMDTLFKKFNVSDWCIGDINEDIEHVFYKDYSGFESTLKKEQDFAYDYLKGALDIK